MGQHAWYGISLFEKIDKDIFSNDRELTEFKYQGGTSACIDGVIKGKCAIEIESRVDKQVRGALVDLLLHPYSKKLLVIIPAHMNNPDKSIEQYKDILARFKRPTDQVKVVLLKGTGDAPNYEEDTVLLKKALRELDLF